MCPPSIRPSPKTRREALVTGAAALASGIATSTAGCLSSLPPLGRKQSYGRLDVPNSGDAEYRRWLPSPAALDGSPPHYGYFRASPASVTGGEPEEFLGRRAASKAELEYFGIGYEHYDRLLKCDFGTVVEADVDADAVVETLRDSGYDPAGTYREFDLFARSDVPRRAAVRDGTVVWASKRVHEAPNVEALVDAGVGAGERYHEASESFARLSDAAGANRQLILAPGFGDPTDRAELGANAFRFDADAAYQLVTLLFPESRVPTADALERAFRDEYSLTAEASVFDVRVAGRLGTLETRVPRGDGRELTPLSDPPQITWGFDADADAATVEVRHEAGDPVDAEWLWYSVETPDRKGELVPQALWPNATRVTPGDRTTVDLSDHPDATGIDVVVATAECCDFRVLSTYELE